MTKTQRILDLSGYNGFPEDSWTEQADYTHQAAFSDCEICYRQAEIDTFHKVEEFLYNALNNGDIDAKNITELITNLRKEIDNEEI